MAFLSALDTLEEVREEKLEESLWREVRRLLEEFLEEQTQQKKEDHFLVEKVQNLEEKLKSITEDGNIKYTIEELSAFLDMDTEEMEAILRLTGDETGKVRAFQIIEWGKEAAYGGIQVESLAVLGASFS